MNATQLSSELAGIVERAAPSVVRVSGRRRRASSGLVWSPEIVVTANHNVERDDEVEIFAAGAGAVLARVIGRDPATDLAALRPEGALAAPPVSGAASAASPPSAGHLVLGIARPGRTARATLGIVSRVAEAWRTPLGGRVDAFLETDLALHPGFSGSALVNSEGRLLGINTCGILRGTSLAIPSATVARVVASLRERGAVRKGYLGIGTYGVRLSAPLEAAAGQPYGLIVLSVQPESPAARAGLLLGDVIIGLDGERVQSAADLVPLLDEESVGREANVRLIRGGALRELKVSIGERGASRSGEPS